MIFLICGLGIEHFLIILKFIFNFSSLLKLQQSDKRNGWMNVGNLQGASHFKIVRHQRIKFLVVGIENSLSIYAWAPRPYSKFMAFKSFGQLTHSPLVVDLTIEEDVRLKVLYGSGTGFHAIDLDSASIYDIYTPPQTIANQELTPHCIVILPDTCGMQLLLCYNNEGVYVNTYGKITKNVQLQWSEIPSSVAYISTNQIMGWGNKAIEIRSVETGHLDGNPKRRKHKNHISKRKGNRGGVLGSSMRNCVSDPQLYRGFNHWYSLCVENLKSVSIRQNEFSKKIIPPLWEVLKNLQKNIKIE
uniref:non-specific serine/threonine protein kinase n=1 Tax=Meloidogyne incognita TaxID=6306 RepID=A0A914LKS8_MELIC